MTWSLIPGPSWEWVHQLTCSQTVCASSRHGVRVHRLCKLELFHNLGIEGLYHGDIMVFCCALNGNQPTLYTNTHVVLFHLLKESVIQTLFTPSIQKSVAHNIKMRVSLLTHSSLVSQILSILSTELVMKMPVSWGYHCTIEMAWDSVLVTALFHKCPSVWSKRDITFVLLHPFYPECFLYFPFSLSHTHTSVGVTTRYSTLTGAGCISEPQPFLPSSFLPPSLLSHSRHIGVGDHGAFDPSTTARWSLNLMNHKSTVHISTTWKNTAINNTILDNIVRDKTICGQLSQSSRLAVYIQWVYTLLVRLSELLLFAQPQLRESLAPVHLGKQPGRIQTKLPRRQQLQHDLYSRPTRTLRVKRKIA